MSAIREVFGQPLGNTSDRVQAQLDRTLPEVVAVGGLAGDTGTTLAEDFLPDDDDDVEVVLRAIRPADHLAVVLDSGGSASRSDPGRVEPVKVDVDPDGLEALLAGDVPLDGAVRTAAGELLTVVDVVGTLEGCGAVVDVSGVSGVDGIQALIGEKHSHLLDAAKVWGFPPELAVLFATGCAVVLGYLTGLLAIRSQGIYFAMITLALAQMIFFFYVQAPFTGGEDGIQAVPRGKLFGLIDLSNQAAMYVFVSVIFFGAFLMIWRIVQSPFGQILKAIRENEPRAISLGYDTDRFKLIAYVLSAGFSGLAGAVKALLFQLASLTDVYWTMSGEVVLMTLLGGMGTLFGPVIGAGIIITMQNYLAQLGAWVTVVQGLIFVICVLAFRRGVVGEIAHRLKKSL